MVGEFLSNRAPQATAIQVGRSAGNAPKATKKKILLCAPSNAAIDEVAKRICAGIFVGGKKVVPSVVRVGAENSINISAREISLEALVQKKLDQELPGAPDDTNSPLAKMRSELAKTKTDMNQKRQELATSQGNSARVAELGNQLSEMAQTAARLSRELNTVRDKQNDNRKVMDAARRRIRAEILSDADVVCSTLSGSGHEMISEYDFDTVIIDEAAQAVELSSLIPLKYSAKRCILVGGEEF
jgi:senataxin